MHFSDLRERYGPRVVVLNLVKAKEKRPRETILRRSGSVDREVRECGSGGGTLRMLNC